MKKQLILLVIAICLVSGYAVFRSTSSEAAPNAAVSYSRDVQPLLESRCAKCHMGEHVSEGLDMKTYESLMTGSQNGPVITPGDADDSLLIQKVIAGEMPKRGPKLTPVQIQLLTDWIDAGAPNN